jgi:hypothetical protein
MNHPVRRAALRSAWALVFLIPCQLFPIPLAAQGPVGPEPQPASSYAPPSDSSTPPTPWYTRLSLNGLVTSSYVVNLNQPDSRTNQYRVFDFDDGSIKLDEVELVAQLPVSKPHDVGFRVDATFGSSVPRVVASAGLFRNDDGSPNDIDVHQAFVSYMAPAGTGLRVDVGKFTTHVGYEVIDGFDGYNDDQSRSFLFGYAQPATHVGVRIGYALNRAASIQVLAVNGWDVARDNNRGKSFGAQLALTPTSWLTTYVNYIGGPEQANSSSNFRHLLDLVAIGKALPWLTLAANYDYGREPGAGAIDAGMTTKPDATWQGLALYGRADLSSRAAISVRGEWFDDPDGARTGVAQTLREITFTPEFTVREGFLLRGDVRRDWSDRHVFEDHDEATAAHQVTVSLSSVFVW